MSVVRWKEGEPEIDAVIAARAMKLAVEYFVRQMRSGAIQGRVERGIDHDAGRHRISFRFRDRELKLIVGDDGEIVSQDLTLPTPRWSRG